MKALIQSLILLFTLVNSTGATRYVSTTGSNSNDGLAPDNAHAWLTITYGLAHISGGDTLLLVGGQYNELIDHAPAGSEGAYTTIAAYNGQSVTVQAPAGSVMGVTFADPAYHHIKLDGIKFDAVNSLNDCFKVTSGSYSITATNCDFFNAPHGHGVLMTEQDLAPQRKDTDCLIVNCRVYRNGLQYDGGVDSPLHGVYVHALSNTFDGVEIYSNKFYGIHQFNGSASGLVVKNCKIHNNGETGIGIMSNVTTNALIYNNLIYSNGYIGIKLGTGVNAGVGGVRILNNTIVSNSVSIYVQADLLGSASYIENNICTGGHNPVDPSGLIIAAQPASDLYVRNNLTYGNGATDYGNPGGALLHSSGNLVGNTYSAVFTSLSTPDYSLQGTSSAINAGLDESSYFSTDYAGISRPQSTSWDIGAYEYPVLPGYYISTTGNDTTGNGSFALPWATVGKANSSCPANSTVWMRGGTYLVGYTSFEITGGTLSGYPGETAILDGQGTAPIDPDTPLLAMQYADQTVTNLIVQNSQRHGIFSKGPRQKISHVISRQNGKGGIWITGAAATNCVIEYSLSQSNSMYNDQWTRNYPPYYNSSGITVARGGINSIVQYCTNDCTWGEGMSFYETTNVFVHDCVGINASPNLYISDVRQLVASNILLHLVWQTGFIDPAHLNGVNVGIWDEQAGANRSMSNKLINILALGGQRCLSVGSGGFSWGLNNVEISHCTFAYPQGDYNAVIGAGTCNTNGVIHDCIFVGAGTNGLASIGAYSGGAVAFDYNDWPSLPTALARGAHDVTGDALLDRTGPTNYGGLTGAYFKWPANSPAHGTGTYLGYGYDYFGNVRSDPPDMGGYEFTTTLSMVVTPSGLYFGSVLTNTTKDMTLTVSNAGTASFSGAATPTGTGFAVQSGGTYNLAAGATSPTVVRFTPGTTVGVSTGYVIFTGADGSTNVLNAEGVAIYSPPAAPMQRRSSVIPGILP